MLSRRNFLATSAVLTVNRLLRAQTAVGSQGLPHALAALEASTGGRIGVAMLDIGTSQLTGYRLDELFPMCSSFKFFLAAALLSRVDQGKEHLQHEYPIPPKPLLPHSPLTEPHAGATMSIAALCHAALVQSDNTAANVLLASLGGPPALTRYLRSTGDRTTRLDRNEPTLNTCIPGDPRDTSSPRATVTTWREILLGPALKPLSQDLLKQWIVANETGNERFRAGTPPTWRIGDKTGSDGETTSNDVAIIYPPHRPPLIVAAYLTQCPGPESRRSAALAQVARLITTT